MSLLITDSAVLLNKIISMKRHLQWWLQERMFNRGDELYHSWIVRVQAQDMHRQLHTGHRDCFVFLITITYFNEGVTWQIHTLSVCIKMRPHVDERDSTSRCWKYRQWFHETFFLRTKEEGRTQSVVKIDVIRFFTSAPIYSVRVAHHTKPIPNKHQKHELRLSEMWVHEVILVTDRSLGPGM